MSTTEYYGNTHKFTSRGPDKNIKITTGVNESLVLDSSSFELNSTDNLTIAANNDLNINAGNDLNISYSKKNEIVDGSTRIVVGAEGPNRSLMTLGEATSFTVLPGGTRLNIIADAPKAGLEISSFVNNDNLICFTDLSSNFASFGVSFTDLKFRTDRDTMTLDAENGYVNIPRGLVTNNSFGYVSGGFGQIILNNTQTTLTTYWNGTPVLQGDQESPTFSAGSFTIKKAGLYYISSNIIFTPNNVGIRISSIIKNGSALELFSTDNRTALSSSRTNCSCQAILQLSLNETIQVVAYQFSGSSLALDNVVKGDFLIYRLQ